MPAKKLIVALGLAFAFLAMQTPNFATADTQATDSPAAAADVASINLPLIMYPALFDGGERSRANLDVYRSNGFLGPFYRDH